MPTPVFDFTTRAVPVVQMGRFQRLYRGRDRWGAARNAGWGAAKWGRGPGTLYEPVWADVTCDVHEVTTNIGRSSASDRFAPATAEIVASNVTGWGDGEVPIRWPTFVDDFERDGPELDSSWDRWTDMEAFRPAMDQLVITENETGERAATVQAHRADDSLAARTVPSLELRSTFQAQGTTPGVTIGPFPDAVAGDVVWLSVVVAGGDFATESAAFTLPGWTATLPGSGTGTGQPYTWRFYRHRLTAEEVATDVPWTGTSAGSWNYTGWIFGGVGEPNHDLAQIGNQGVVEAGRVPGGPLAYFDSVMYDFDIYPGHYHVETDGAVVVRVMMVSPPISLDDPDVVEISAGDDAGTFDFVQFVAIDGGTTPTEYEFGDAVPALHFDWAEPPSSPWPAEWFTNAFFVIRPGDAPSGGPAYEGSSGNRWALPYVGDHFVETTVSALAAPERVWPGAYFLIELYLHLVDGDLTSQVAMFEWVPDWDDPDIAGTITWTLDRRDADGELKAGAPFATGSDVIGAAGFPDRAVLRFEADTDGTLRLMFQGRLLAEAVDPAPPDGQHIAIYSDYFAGSLSYGRTIQPGPTRFEELAAGSHVPNPIYLEPGALIRIGVYHQRYDFCWLFRGYVDALTPVYDPELEDTVRIECIDALGEAGRLKVNDRQDGEIEATDRVRYVLNQAEWPVELRRLDDDATIMAASNAGEGRVVDLLTQIAESCGGAVYGGPGTGCVTFRRKDWQGWDPDLHPVDGYITNRLDVSFTGLVVCPSGWVRSWDRADMTTRVTYRPSDGDDIVYRNADAERRWGIEDYERDLVTVYTYPAKILAQRQLRLRGPDKFPRVEAVLLDAAVDDDTLDLMATATFTKPHQYQCQLDRPDGSHVFNQRMLVTGLRHVLTPSSWTLRIALDLAGPFRKIGGQWSNPGKGRGRWGVDVWSNA